MLAFLPVFIYFIDSLQDLGPEALDPLLLTSRQPGLGAALTNTAQAPGVAAATADVQQHGVFGPLIEEPPLNEQELEDDESGANPEPAEEVENLRKRQVDSQHQLPNGTSAKRPKLNNPGANGRGYENGAERATSPMEIDQHRHHSENNHAYPSPLEGEQDASTPVPRTEGPEQGTQTDKIEDLSGKTTWFRLPGQDESSSPTTAGPAAAPPPVETLQPQNPRIMHCEWNPKDPSRLAAAGTDALARVWTVSPATASEPVKYHVGDLVDEDCPPKQRATAMAWDADGTHIAIASHDDEFDLPKMARIEIWGADGSRIQRFNVPEPPIIRLKWNETNNSLLSIAPSRNPLDRDAPEKDGTVVTVYPMDMPNTISVFLEDHHPYVPGHQETDAAWISASDFVLSGGERLIQYRCTDEKIELIKEFTTRQHETPEEQGPADYFTQVEYDSHTGAIVAASMRGNIDVSQASASSVLSLTSRLRSGTKMASQFTPYAHTMAASHL